MRTVAALGILLLAVSTWAHLPLNHLHDGYSASDEPTYETVLTLPVGHPDSPRYEGGAPEMLRWGPTALTVGPDGSFWIADAAANRLLQYDRSSGRLLRQVNLDGVTVGVRDIEVDREGIWVLDISAIAPAVVRLSYDGKVMAHFELPKGLHLEDGLSGIALTDKGELLAERYGGAFVIQLLDANRQLNLAPLNGYPSCGETYSLIVPLITESNATTGYILRGSQDKPHVQVTVEQRLGGLFLLKALPDGSLYVLVEEVAFGETVQVDQRVHRYDANGNLTGIARIPLNEQHTYVHHVAAVGPDGEVYVLLTRPDRFEVARLIFYPYLSPILKASEPLPESQQESDFYPASCISRAAMRSVVDGYINNRVYLNNTNIDPENRRCANRGIPHYLGGAGQYDSVPYDWGGFDTPGLFNTAMSQGQQAGDITADTTDNVSCSRGVDCSGFVSRVWQLPQKYSTSGLPNVSRAASTGSLAYGDVYNSPGVHVILYESASANGFNGAESTVYNSLDRVVRGFVPMSRVNGYSVLRYNGACPLPDAPTLVAPSNNSVLSSVPTLQWRAPAHAISYQVEVALDQNFPSVVWGTSTTSTSATPTGLTPNTYWWRVRGVNNEGTGPWSSAWRFTILPDLQSLTINPSSVVGGSTAIGTVSLNGPAPAGGLQVQLSSNNPNVASVPASVTVPAGQTRASFSITTRPVASQTQAMITARLGNSSRQVTLTVVPPSIQSLSISPSTVRGGSNATGIVTLNAPAPPGGAVVPLRSSNSTVATVPASVTIPAGQTTAQFTVRTTRPSSSSVSVTITATYNGSRSAQLTVTR
jgi:hypothetical protein